MYWCNNASRARCGRDALTRRARCGQGLDQDAATIPSFSPRIVIKIATRTLAEMTSSMLLSLAGPWFFVHATHIDLHRLHTRLSVQLTISVSVASRAQCQFATSVSHFNLDKTKKIFPTWIQAVDKGGRDLKVSLSTTHTHTHKKKQNKENEEKIGNKIPNRKEFEHKLNHFLPLQCNSDVHNWKPSLLKEWKNITETITPLLSTEISKDLVGLGL